MLAKVERGLLAVKAVGYEQIELLESMSPVNAKASESGGIVFVLRNSDDVLGTLWEHGLDFRGKASFYGWKPPMIEGKYQAMPHQLDTAAFLTIHRRAYVTSTMRTGKTGAVIMALEYLRRTDPGAALIIAPLSVMGGVWETALLSMTTGGVAALRGSKGDRLRLLRSGSPAYYIINYDGVEIVEPELAAMVKSGRLTKIVIDELTHYGNPSSKRFKALYRIINKGSPRVWGLTGTPAADTMAVFGYAKMVNPSKLPASTRTGWQHLVQVKSGINAWDWRDRREAPDIVARTLQPNIRFVKDDVLPDLPPVTTARETVEMSAEQKVAYQQLRDLSMTIIKSGEVLKAEHKTALIHKLFQISQGTVKEGEGGVVKLDSSPRLRRILEIISRSSRKTVIFGAYVGANDDLVKRLRESGLSVEKIDGSVTGLSRDKIFKKFQSDGPPRVLVAHAKTTAYGVDLASADQIIFNGPMMSGLHTYLQAIERLSSGKQKAPKVSIFHVVSTSEESRFQRNLDAGARMADAVADVFKIFIGGWHG
jgi:SNF2 family DNA or RNA helicase